MSPRSSRESSRRRQRREPPLDAGRTLVVLCEGSRTEIEYLDTGVRDVFRYSRRAVRVFHLGDTDPRALVRTATELMNNPAARASLGIESYLEIDEFWVVVDVEGTHERQLAAREAIELAASAGVKVAISNPSFEVWLVMHHEDCVAGLSDGNGALRKMEAVCPGYSKDNPPRPTLGELSDAGTRAASGRERHIGNSGDGDPSTNVDQLIGSLRDAAPARLREGLPTFKEYDPDAPRLIAGLGATGLNSV